MKTIKRGKVKNKNHLEQLYEEVSIFLFKSGPISDKTKPGPSFQL
jgi:hypothetical protein